jgi:hypothetical protein
MTYYLELVAKRAFLESCGDPRANELPAHAFWSICAPAFCFCLVACDALVAGLQWAGLAPVVEVPWKR